jgi:hypothetical protein
MGNEKAELEQQTVTITLDRPWFRWIRTATFIFHPDWRSSKMQLQGNEITITGASWRLDAPRRIVPADRVLAWDNE